MKTKLKLNQLVGATLAALLLVAAAPPEKAQAGDNDWLWAVAALGVVVAVDVDDTPSNSERLGKLAKVAWPWIQKVLDFNGALAHGEFGTEDDVVSFALSSLENLATKAEGASDEEIEAYLKKLGEDELAKWIASEGGAGFLHTQLERVSPHLADALYRERSGVALGVLPRAQAALYEQGRIPAPTWQALCGAWAGGRWTLTETGQTGQLTLTDEDEDWFIKVLADELGEVRAERRRSLR